MPLPQASQEPNTAKALRAKRDASVRCLAEKGRPIPRATEMDLYAIIVKQGFRNTPDNRSAHKALAVYCKQHCSPEVYRFAFQSRLELPALIDDVWTWELMEEDLTSVSQTPVQRLLQAGGSGVFAGGTGGMWQRMH